MSELINSRAVTFTYDKDAPTFLLKNIPIGVNYNTNDLPKDKDKTFYANVTRMDGGKYGVLHSVSLAFDFEPFVPIDKAILCFYSTEENNQDAIRCINQIYSPQDLTFDLSEKLEAHTLYGADSDAVRFDAFSSFTSDDNIAFFVMSEKDFLKNKGQSVGLFVTHKSKDALKDLPVLNGDYVLMSNMQPMHDFMSILIKRKSESSVPVLITGSSGDGKSKFIQNFANHYNIPLFTLRMNAMVPDDPMGIFGNTKLENATGKIVPHIRTVHYDGQEQKVSTLEYYFSRKWNGIRRILFLDEFNRTKSSLRNMMYQLFNNEEVQYDGEVFKEPENLIIYVAANMDYENVDTELVDAAFVNRFAYIYDLNSNRPDISEIESMLVYLYKGKIEPRQIHALVTTIQKISLNYNLYASTREFRQMCDFLSDGVGFEDTIRSTFINKKVYINELDKDVANKIEI